MAPKKKSFIPRLILNQVPTGAKSQGDQQESARGRLRQPPGHSNQAVREQLRTLDHFRCDDLRAGLQPPGDNPAGSRG